MTFKTTLRCLAPAFGGALLAACGGDSTPGAQAATAQARPALTVQVIASRRDSWPGVVEASGPVAPWQEASIGTELAGVRLEEVLVNVGDVVESGQLLARFSQDSLKADLAQLEAQVAEREASLEKARLDAKGADRLERYDALAKSQIRAIRTQAAVAEAQLASARAQRDAQALRLGYASVRAPDAGVISARSATVGTVAAPGAELFRLIRRGRLEWRAEVRADALPLIKRGAKAAIRLQQGGALEGTVRQVAPSVNPETLNGIVYVDLPAGAPLAAGLFVSGEFELAPREVLVVPATAVVFRSGHRYVMEIGPDARVSEVKVETGQRRGADVEVLEGLAEGARIVASGGAFLNHGDLVTVAGKPAP